jgi:CBS domain-containing protein
MLVKDIMSKDVVTIESHKTVLEACIKYKELNVGSLVVVKNEFIFGILKRRNIFERFIIRKKNPQTTKVKDIMSKDIKTIHASAKIEKAAEMMKHYKIKKLPVILNNEIAGIITVTDIANCMPRFAQTLFEGIEPFKFVSPI